MSVVSRLFSGCFMAIFILLSLPGSHGQQVLQPGFDAVEYSDLLQLNFKMMFDSLPVNNTYQIQKGNYQRLFRSPEVGLYNRCEAYVRDDNTGIISLRGTIGKAESWIENFYLAMVKANGSLQLNDSTVFTYQLAADSQAMVHVGWLLGLACLSPYINEQVDSFLSKGITNIIIMGHSQGGALAFLTTSYIWYKYHDRYPAMKLKTYASAAPKPGNLFYAYDFDFISGDGYGYRIVNTADWVPETPVSVQTVKDFNTVSPLTNAKQIIKKQKFGARIALNHAYNKLDKHTYKAMKYYRKYGGKFMHKQVVKTLKQLRLPDLQYSINYMPAGSPVILYADSAYLSTFKYDGKDIFIHHLLKPYQYLLNRQYGLK